MIGKEEGISLSFLRGWLKSKTGTYSKRSFLPLTKAAHQLNSTVEDLLIFIRNSPTYHGYQSNRGTFVHCKVVTDEIYRQVEPYVEAALMGRA
jgi:hypothetical protein